MLNHSFHLINNVWEAKLDSGSEQCTAISTVEGLLGRRRFLVVIRIEVDHFHVPIHACWIVINFNLAYFN